MNKAKELLDELQNLDEEIQNRIDELANLEASLLSSPKMNVNKVQGGQKIQLDERYIDIFSMQDSLKEYMKDATEEARKSIQKEFKKDDPTFNIESCRVEEVAIINFEKLKNFLQEVDQ
ncbi:DUF1492 domain-containing protein [Streptococcus suis]|uniref:DUF1492 domain-containing protein n=1 Tax=Streptococcus suis TaxID=1307 RepID=UPI0038BC16E3